MEKMQMKKDVLKGIIKDMLSKGGEGLKKVSVMAKDTEGLKQGLEKAEEVLGEEKGMCEECGKEECPGCEEEQDLESMSKEQLIAMLKNK